jgi:ectoine hydroxylase
MRREHRCVAVDAAISASITEAFMKLTDAQIAEYDRNGFLILPDMFSGPELDVLRSELQRVSGTDAPGINREDNGEIRSMYRLHHSQSPTFSKRFEKFITLPRIVEPAKQLLRDDELYVFQTKCNLKQPIYGGIYNWHQDFGHWQHDGIPTPQMVTSLLMVDDATELSGCLYFLPGSHKLGVLETQSEVLTATMNIWAIPGRDLIGAMQKLGDPVPVKGKAGTIVIFHPNLLHASGHNLSRYSRWHIFTVFNCISNKQRPVANPRAEWAVDREFKRVDLTDDNLLELERREAVAS